MSEHDQFHDIRFFRAFLRPAYVVMMVAQMLLGLALAVTLIVKFYMLVFSPLVCTADGATLGNMIRCTPTLEIAAHFVLGLAGFRFAAFMFQDRPRMIFGPMMLGLAGVLLLFVSGVTPQGASWPIAAVIVTLLGCMSALFGAQYLLRRTKDTD